MIESPSFPQQALLYRLNGDKNPLHADPDFAAMGGFDRPIIHGLCSYGITLKAIVDRVLDGDVTRVARYQARFAGRGAFPARPTSRRTGSDGDTILLQAKVKERDAHGDLERRGDGPGLAGRVATAVPRGGGCVLRSRARGPQRIGPAASYPFCAHARRYSLKPTHHPRANAPAQQAKRRRAPNSCAVVRGA